MSSLSELQNKLSKEEIKLIKKVREIPYGEVTTVIQDGKIKFLKVVQVVHTKEIAD